MKKLTIGSLKYGSTKSTVMLNQPVMTEKLKENDATNKAAETNKILEIKQNQRMYQVKVKKNQSILDAALEQNLTLEYSCKKGTCGKCKVIVVNGNTSLQPVNNLEDKKLHDLVKSGYRLACQAKAR